MLVILHTQSCSISCSLYDYISHQMGGWFRRTSNPKDAGGSVGLSKDGMLVMAEKDQTIMELQETVQVIAVANAFTLHTRAWGDTALHIYTNSFTLILASFEGILCIN